MNATNATNSDILLRNFLSAPLGYAVSSTGFIICVWLIVANSTVLCLFIKFPQQRTLINLPIINVAVADLIMGCVYIITCIRYIIRWYPDIVEKNFCIYVIHFIGYPAYCASIHGLFLAVLERYIKILHPYRYHILVTKSSIVKALIAIWILAFTQAVTIINYRWTTGSVCNSEIIHPITHYFTMVYAMFVMTALTFLNISIVCAVFKQRRNIKTVLVKEFQRSHNNKSDSTTSSDGSSGGRTKMIGIMMMFMYICIIPYFIGVIMGFFKMDGYIVANRLGYVFCLLNNAVNPVIFVWKNREMKVCLEKMLRLDDI